MSRNIDIIKKEITEALSDNPPDFDKVLTLSSELAKLDPNHQRFFVDAKTLIHLGRDSIKDHTTALLELVKNSYDADAKNVEIEIFSKTSDKIRIADNGFGMTEDELKNNWLRVGFSAKRVSKKSKLGRRKTGEKGIGRISTDRLGSILEIRTKSAKDRLIGLKLNWDDFDVEGKNVSDIKVKMFYPDEINLPPVQGKKSDTGTEIIISGQRQSWSLSNIENLYQELVALTPPFEEVEDFDITLSNDIYTEVTKKIDRSYLKAAEISIEAYYDGKGSEIIYTYWDKYNNKEKIERIDWQNLLSKSNLSEEYDKSNKLRCGPVNLKLYFFLREAASVKDMDFNLKKLREFLDNNAGIKVYRDKIVVKPYGFPSSQFGYDWLELADRKAQDPAGISRSQSYRVTPNQLVGGVFITRDSNVKLSDSAAREGLVESEAFYDLRNLTLGSINMLESYRTKLVPQIKQSKGKSKSTKTNADKIIKTLSTIEKDLDEINHDIQNSSDVDLDTKDRIQKNVLILSKTTAKVEKTINDLLNWNRTLSGLATIGISSAVFGHETEGSITQFKGSINAAKLTLKRRQPNIENALSEIEKAIKYSNKVAAWGAYALTRVQREKRGKKDINLKRTINNVISELKPAFKAASINITFIGDVMYSYTYQMDIETILINLLTNAYTAATQKAGERNVLVKLTFKDKKLNKRKELRGCMISVSDSGHGISEEFKHRVFEPLFSTKVNPTKGSNSVGTGLGLTVVSSIIKELKGEITFDKDPDLKGARFKVWLPIEKKAK
ncbi:sensor histidine kinase [Pseudofulvibacter geojedonensis]|uniref:histidine kinase n=1 Tax=Pseudofulvibacter geojedonensis TaxID=1123758 RepID=A0ABW3HYA6_9FLAO